jgi:hypothetical protein
MVLKLNQQKECGFIMTKNDCQPSGTRQSQREIDLRPIGWYEFPLESSSDSSIFDYLIGQFWRKELTPPEADARVLFAPTNMFSIEYRGFHEAVSGEGLVCTNNHVRLTRSLSLHKGDLRATAWRWLEGASAVVQKTFNAFESSIPRRNDGSIDMRALAGKVNDLLDVAPDQASLQANKDWIFMGLPDTIHQILRESCGIHYLGMLFDKYKGMGGMDNERAFQVNMGLLFHIYKPAVSKSNLLRPDGKTWRSEREIINTWEGMTQTRLDAWRYLQVVHNFCDFTRPEMVPEKFRKYDNIAI